MANPTRVTINKNTWTKVATAAEGIITIRDWQPNTYYMTYVVAGDPAPVGDQTIDTSILVRNYQVVISDDANIDIYMYAYNYDGSVIVAV